MQGVVCAVILTDRIPIHECNFAQPLLKKKNVFIFSISNCLEKTFSKKLVFILQTCCNQNRQITAPENLALKANLSQTRSNEKNRQHSLFKN